MDELGFWKLLVSGNSFLEPVTNPMHYDMVINDRKIENICLGPSAFNNDNNNLVSTVWRVAIDAGKFILSKWDNSTSAWVVTPTPTLTTTGDCTYPAVAFDQLGKPLLTFMRAGRAWLWWYNPVTTADELRDLGPALSVVIGITSPYSNAALTSDLVVVLLETDGLLVYRLQKDRYDIRYNANVDLSQSFSLVDPSPSPLTSYKLVNCGLRTDNTFGVRYCKVKGS